MDEVSNARPTLRARIRGAWLTARLATVVALGIVGVVLALSLPVSGRTQALSARVGDVSGQDVLAPYALSYTSEVLTAVSRRDAAEAVEPIYDPPDSAVARQQLSRLRTLLGYVDAVRSDVHATQEQRLADLAAMADVRLNSELRHSGPQPAGGALGSRQSGGDHRSRAGAAQRDSRGRHGQRATLAAGAGQRHFAGRPGGPGGLAGLGLRRPQQLLQLRSDRNRPGPGFRACDVRGQVVRRRRDRCRARGRDRRRRPRSPERLRLAPSARRVAPGGAERADGHAAGGVVGAVRASDRPGRAVDAAAGDRAGGRVHGNSGGHAGDGPRAHDPAVSVPGRRGPDDGGGGLRSGDRGPQRLPVGRAGRLSGGPRPRARPVCGLQWGDLGAGDRKGRAASDLLLGRIRRKPGRGRGDRPAPPSPIPPPIRSGNCRCWPPAGSTVFYRPAWPSA